MKALWDHLEQYRQQPRGYESHQGDHFGWFVWFRGKTQLRAMAADASEDSKGWEHVSVSVAYRVGNDWKERDPTWEEMCFIKKAFWNDDECVVQFHPPESSYVNIH